LNRNEIASCSASLLANGWLSHCRRDFAESFISHCHWSDGAAGTGIQHAGATGGAITGIAKGSVVLTTSLSAPDTPAMHVMSSGEWFGYIPIFIAGSRPNSFVARTDVVLASMPQSEIETLLATRPEWWRDIGILGILSSIAATGRAADMMIRESSRRCAAILLQLANCRHLDPPSAQKLDAPLSQEELAAIANLSRTSLSAILRNFEDAGLIKLGYRSVTLKSPAKLRAFVDSV
jgi:CRP-like cAMP-binding protein